MNTEMEIEDSVRKTKKKLSSALFLTSALMVGCSSSIETNGQVFIDTSGSASKVALAEIYVVSEETLVNNLKTSLSSMNDDYERLRAAHHSNSELREKASGLFYEAKGGAWAASRWSYSERAAAAELVAEIEAKLHTATRVYEAAQSQYDESEALLEGLANGSNSQFFLPAAIHGASLAATSDVDGNFKLSLEADKRVAIIGKKKNLTWLIWIQPKKGDQIFLTDKNLNGTQCEACVFNKAQLSSTLAFIPAAFASLQAKPRLPPMLP